MSDDRFLFVAAVLAGLFGIAVLFNLCLLALGILFLFISVMLADYGLEGRNEEL